MGNPVGETSSQGPGKAAVAHPPAEPPLVPTSICDELPVMLRLTAAGSEPYMEPGLREGPM